MATGGKGRFGAVQGQDRLDFGRNVLNLVSGRDPNYSYQPSSSGPEKERASTYTHLWPSVGGSSAPRAEPEAMAIDGFSGDNSFVGQISEYGGSMESPSGGSNVRNGVGTGQNTNCRNWPQVKRSNSAGGSLGSVAPTYGYQPPPPPKKGILKNSVYEQNGRRGLHSNRYAPYPQGAKKSIRFADMDDVQGGGGGITNGGTSLMSFPGNGDAEIGQSDVVNGVGPRGGGGAVGAGKAPNAEEEKELAQVAQELSKSVLGQLRGDGCVRSFTPFELDRAIPQLCSTNKMIMVRLYGMLHEVSEPLQQPPFRLYRIITIRDVAKNTLVRGICYEEFPGNIQRLAASAGNVFVRAFGRLTQDMQQVMLQILSVRAASQQEKQEFLAQSFSAW